MFTKGQLIFAIIFVILFALVIGYSYIKDDMKYEIYQPGQKKDFIKENSKRID